MYNFEHKSGRFLTYIEESSVSFVDQAAQKSGLSIWVESDDHGPKIMTNEKRTIETFWRIYDRLKGEQSV